MAHFGKLFPAPFYPRVISQFTGTQRFWPARRLFIRKQSLSSPGAVSDLWGTAEILSDLVEPESPSSTRFKYRWSCPGDPTQEIIALMRFVQATPTLPDPLGWTWDRELTNYVGGSPWFTDSDTTITSSAFPTGAIAGLFLLGSPPNTHPGDWTAVYWGFRVAKWADDPAFHPYRH